MDQCDEVFGNAVGSLDLGLASAPSRTDSIRDRQRDDRRERRDDSDTPSVQAADRSN